MYDAVGQACRGNRGMRRGRAQLIVDLVALAAGIELPHQSQGSLSAEPANQAE